MVTNLRGVSPDAALWDRIVQFDFDADAPPGYFVTKLARDNGWSTPYAQRVVEEYRRYTYLACVASHVVVPSDQVDMAWHQHLLDTHQYWDVFCTTVLTRPLHHRPNKGRVGDLLKHFDLYEVTLTTYADAFGHEPPSDIWPPVWRRFGWDVRRHWFAPAGWIMSKQCILRRARPTAITAPSTAAANLDLKPNHHG